MSTCHTVCVGFICKFLIILARVEKMCVHKAHTAVCHVLGLFARFYSTSTVLISYVLKICVCM